LKDNFSIQSDEYAKYRPTYPEELYEILLPLVPSNKTAWDCGTGNGQVASKLADFFDKVHATDISIKQIGNALKKANIEYLIEPAGKTSFANNQFDLITVAQAIHWFDLDKFYSEAKRTLKPNGIIAVIGYSLIRFNPAINQIIDDLHDNILGDYWDDARKLIEEHYRTLPFPFIEIQTRELGYKRNWTLDELVGYLSTWSALQHYIRKKNKNPIQHIAVELQKQWTNKRSLEGTTPVFMRIGKV